MELRDIQAFLDVEARIKLRNIDEFIGQLVDIQTEVGVFGYPFHGCIASFRDRERYIQVPIDHIELIRHPRDEK